uniref:Uncharacterized protein n=1 Tax=Sinocyclocheilus grahami TaxID=75366 RepID=A0A672QF84_SINGR
MTTRERYNVTYSYNSDDVLLWLLQKIIIISTFAFYRLTKEIEQNRINQVGLCSIKHFHKKSFCDFVILTFLLPQSLNSQRELLSDTHTHSGRSRPSVYAYQCIMSRRPK